MNSREKILSRIKKALENPTASPMPKPDASFSVFTKSEQEDMGVLFAENFVKAKVDFFYCETLENFLSNLKIFLAERDTDQVYVWEEYLQQLFNFAEIPFKEDDKDFLDAEIGITLCEALTARTGSIIVSSRQHAGRRLGIYPHAHIVVAFASQIHADLEDALDFLQKKYIGQFPCMFSVISGPSQTADIEKTLVLGAHGPKELILFLIDE